MQKLKKFIDIARFCWNFGASLSSKLTLTYLLTKPAFDFFKIDTENLYELPCKFHNKEFTLYLRQVDVIILREMFEWQDYKPIMSNLEPKIIWDIGANIGLASLYLSCLYPSAQFIGFEPSAKEREIAQKNYRNLSQASQIKELALGKENTEATMLIDVTRVGGQHLEMYNPNADDRWQRETVSVRCAASLIATDECPLPDLLKIDVEGAEHDVLLGFGAFLSKIGYVVMEAHSRDLYERCSELLINCGFDRHYEMQKGETDVYFLWFKNRNVARD